MHTEEFSDFPMPFMIANMQLWGAFCAELINIFSLSTRISVSESITFFVAFHLLVSIDDIYATGVSDYPLLDATLEPLVFTKNLSDVKRETIHDKFFWWYTRSIYYWYNTIYYYYLPFVINLVPYLFLGDIADEPVEGIGH